MTRLVLATALSVACTLVQGQTYEVKASAVVVSSSSGLPSIGSSMEINATYSYDPNAYVSPGSFCGAGCTSYAYMTPYLYAITSNAGSSQFSSFEVSITDNTALYAPEIPVADSVEFGAKQNAIGYLLGLVGPSTSFSGTALPSPTAIESFSTLRYFRISTSATTLLYAQVTQLTVSAVSEPATIATLLSGLLVLAPVIRRRKREA